MIAILIIVVLVLIGTHYAAYILGEEAAERRCINAMRILQEYNKKVLEVKSATKRARKVLVNKK